LPSIITADAFWLEHALQFAGDLLRQALLYLQSAAKEIN
jgi:hypothetical protein